MSSARDFPGCGLQIGFGHVEAVGLQPGEIGSLSLVTLHPTGRSGHFDYTGNSYKFA